MFGFSGMLVRSSKTNGPWKLRAYAARTASTEHASGQQESLAFHSLGQFLEWEIGRGGWIRTSGLVVPNHAL